MSESTVSPKTVVALFEFRAQADRAVDELRKEGFTQGSITVVAGHELSHPEEYVVVTEHCEGKVIHAIEKGLAWGGGVGAIAGGISSLLVPGLGPLVIGGALATTFMGAGLGASVGGVMAGLMKAGVDESEARLFETALRSGGVIVTVHTDESNAYRAVQALKRRGALETDEQVDEEVDEWDDGGADEIDGSATYRLRPQ